jgi:hypothetical protein
MRIRPKERGRGSICEPCRNGPDAIGAFTGSGKPVLNRELCASRLTRCRNRRRLVGIALERQKSSN